MFLRSLAPQESVVWLRWVGYKLEYWTRAVGQVEGQREMRATYVCFQPFVVDEVVRAYGARRRRCFVVGFGFQDLGLVD